MAKKGVGQNPLTRDELLRSLKGNTPLAPAYLIYGEETYLLQHALKAVLKKASPQGLSLDVRVVDVDKKPANIDFQALRDELQTPTFLSPFRMVVLKNSELFTSSRYHDETLDLISQIPEGASLVFLEDKVDGRYRKVYTAIEEVGGIITFIPKQSDQELIRWIAAYFHQTGNRITQSACDSLLLRADSSMLLLLQEMKKLKLYAQAEGLRSINLETVDKICIPDLQGSIFNLGDRIVQSQTVEAIEIFHRLLEKREPIQVLMLMLGRLFRQLLITHLSWFRQDRLANMLGERRPFILRRLLQQARPYQIEQLRALVKQSAEIDEAIKGGSSLDPEFIVETLILTAASAAR